MSSNSERRKKIFINPSFQVKFVAYSSIFTCISLIIFYFAIHIFFNSLKRQGLDLQLTIDHPYFIFISEQQSFFNTLFIITSFILVILLTFCGIFISHKIVGPIERLKSYMKEKVENNDINDLVFRDDDFFQDLAKEFCDFCRKYKNK
jgi:hypothetical protein